MLNGAVLPIVPVGMWEKDNMNNYDYEHTYVACAYPVRPHHSDGSKH